MISPLDIVCINKNVLLPIVKNSTTMGRMAARRALVVKGKKVLSTGMVQIKERVKKTMRKEQMVVVNRVVEKAEVVKTKKRMLKRVGRRL